MQVVEHRLVLHPTDFDKAARWCQDVLGLHPLRTWGHRDAPAGVVFSLGGLQLELREGQTMPPLGVELHVRVHDVFEERDRLLKAGARVPEPVLQPWGCWECRVRSFDGVVFVLVGVPEDHALNRRL